MKRCVARVASGLPPIMVAQDAAIQSNIERASARPVRPIVVDRLPRVVLALAWVVLQILIKMFRSPDMMVVAYSVLVLVGIITTFTESVLWGPFDAQTTLFFVAGAAYAGRERKKLVGHLVVTEKPAQQAPA